MVQKSTSKIKKRDEISPVSNSTTNGKLPMGLYSNLINGNIFWEDFNELIFPDILILSIHLKYKILNHV
jgi:hypothetical protein